MKSLFFLPLLTLLGCGLMAGLFFIFSVCIMKALGQLPPEKGIAAMQFINVVIVNPLFMLVFLGTALTYATWTPPVCAISLPVVCATSLVSWWSPWPSLYP